MDRHPLLFTEAEALEYLHLPADAVRALRTLRDNHGLGCRTLGHTTVYHKRDLDGLVERLFGAADPPPSGAARSPKREPMLKYTGD